MDKLHLGFLYEDAASLYRSDRGVVAVIDQIDIVLKTAGQTEISPALSPE
jgi:hypothetical protein